MQLALTALAFAPALAAANQVTVSPDLSETKPEQHVVVRTSAPGMVRLEVDSQGAGTTCEIVDHLRGPFQSAGALGRTDCSTDLFLDAGLYKVRLRSPDKASKRLRVKATPFAERNQPLRRLAVGREDERELPPGTQASWWIHVEERGHVSLSVTGRSAGRVALWRNGEWVEDKSFNRRTHQVRKGQPRHAWTFEGTLEAGDYLMTAYGTAALEWAEGKPEDTVWVSRAAPRAPSERLITFEIPERGWLRYVLQRKEGLYAAASVSARPDTDVKFALEALAEPRKDFDVGVQRAGGRGSCNIRKANNVPTCAFEQSTRARHMLTIEGAPGTRGEVILAQLADRRLEDGQVTRQRDPIFKAPADGRYLVGTFDVPPDTDAAPLSCELFAYDLRRSVQQARLEDDVVEVDWLSPLVRRFNYDRDETVRFRIGKVGFYNVETDGTKSRCELYKLNGSSRERVSESSTAASCKMKKFLSPGDYELRMHGGKTGIITMKVGQWGLTGKKTTPGKSSCWMRDVELKRGRGYKLVHTRGSGNRRGLIARKLPLNLNEPLPIGIGEGRDLKVEVERGGPLVVRALSGPAFTCALGGKKSRSRDGVCSLPPGEGALEIEPSTEAPLFVTLHRPRPAPSLPPLRAYSPRFTPLPTLRAGQARFFDFDREQSTSLLVDVKEAGLYDVTTTGLLATECRMRTAVEPSLWRDRSGGRGRNCLLQAYLRPGNYLLSVKTTGQSRGRAGIVLRGKPPARLPSLPAGEERFYEADAGALYQTELVVQEDGRYALRSRGQGVELQCRLDDHDGWPVERVPAACDRARSLNAGRYLWTEMPLTVASQRHVELKPMASSELLTGGGPHAVALHKRYNVELDEQAGKDRFTFTLRAPMTIGVELTGGMLGRLYKAGAKEVLEVIAPDGRGAGSLDEADEAYLDEEAEDPCDYEPELCEEEDRGPATTGAPVLRRDAVPGQRVRLPAGDYVLETQHKRADVGIVYQLQLHVAELAPGVERSVPVPSEVSLVVPEAGFLRLRTRGEVDVRCRVFDERGRLRVESASHGDDWNCAFTEPLPQGRYRLIVEREGRDAGSTFVEVSAPRERDGGVLRSNTTLSTGLDVVRASLPKAREGEVLEVDLSAEEPISCAITTPEGRVLAQSVDEKRCRHLVAGADRAPFLARVWTTQRPAEVKVRVHRLPARAGRGGDLPASRAVVADITRPGRYQTGAGVRCHIGDAPGVLEDCSGEVSLPVGRAVFARFKSDGKGQLALSERRWRLDDEPAERASLRSAPTLMAGTSEREALHLYTVELPRGVRASPACAVSGGVSRQTASRCVAAAAPGRASVFSAWTASDRPERARLTGAAATPAGGAQPLGLGARDLRWSGHAAAYKVPEVSTRIELTLDAGAWAVYADKRGRAQGLCAPAAKMGSCSLPASGGTLYVVGAGRARARVFEVEPGPALAQLQTAHESFHPSSGTLQLEVSASERPRTVEVVGEEVRACALLLAGGRRVEGCEARLPANTAARLEVRHGPGALVALAYPRGWREVSRWTTHVPRAKAAALDEGERGPLAGTFADRSVTLAEGGVLSVRADSGVCAIFSGRRVLAVGGLGRGCDLARAVPAGTYRVMVRAFAGRPLAGDLVWARSAVEQMKEGVHPEAWVAAGESRFFRFDVERGSEIGIGVRTDGETLECALRSVSGRAIGRGCQQFKKLERGVYLLEVRAPDGTAPRRFSPVVLGLEGGERDVPEEVLKELLQRVRPEAGVSQ